MHFTVSMDDTLVAIENTQSYHFQVAASRSANASQKQIFLRSISAESLMRNEVLYDVSDRVRFVSAIK